MKNRHLPFGYCMRNGVMEINENEAEIVCRVFDLYRSGSSLKCIAGYLTAQKVEYLPDASAWNKNRVARLLEDSRYLGTDAYPSLVGEEAFLEVQSIRNSRNTQAECDASKAITEAVIPILCGKCGGKTVRRRDHRTAYREKYVCTAPECQMNYYISDEVMTGMISKMLHSIEVEETHSRPDEEDLEIRKQEREISRLLDTPDFDLEQVRNRIFKLAQAKYEAISCGRHITDKLRTDLSRIDPSSVLTRRQIMEIVKEIRLLDDTAIQITLLNGQTVGGGSHGE